MSLLIVGSGGVGTVVALGSSLNGIAEVSLIVRSGYEEICANGFTIESSEYGHIEGWKPAHVYQSVEQAFAQSKAFDYIIITTKNIPDSNNRCEDILKPFAEQIKQHGSVILLQQNGIDIEDAMIDAFPDNLVLSSVNHVGSTRIGNKVVQKRIDQMFVGDFKNPKSKHFPDAEEKIATLIKLLTAPDGKNVVLRDDNVRKTRWEKLVYNSVWNPICMITNTDTTRFSIASPHSALVRPTMEEIVAIARSDGVEVDPSIIDKFLHIGDGLFYPPSMVVDARKKQLMEIEVMIGNPLRIAEKNNVPVPNLRVIYELAKVVQFRVKEELGVFRLNEEDFRGDSEEYPDIFERKYAPN